MADIIDLQWITNPDGTVCAEWQIANPDPLGDTYLFSVDDGPQKSTGAMQSDNYPGNVPHSISITSIANEPGAVSAGYTPPPRMQLAVFGAVPAQPPPPGITALSFTTTWEMLQNSIKGAINWAPTDKAVAYAEEYDIDCWLRVHFGDGCPSDLPGQITLDGSCFGSGPNTPKTVTMPMPNDPVAQGYEKTFISKYGGRYNGVEVVKQISMAGGMRQAEMVTPKCTTWDTLVKKHNLTPEALLESWQFYVQQYTEFFPDKILSLGMENPMGILPKLLAWIEANYGVARFLMQQNGLRATTPTTGNSFWAQAKELGFTLGAQTWGSVAQQSGPLDTELSIGIALGLKKMELYSQDVFQSVNYPLFVKYGEAL